VLDSSAAFAASMGRTNPFVMGVFCKVTRLFLAQEADHQEREWLRLVFSPHQFEIRR
jgi:hypothetical protein